MTNPSILSYDEKSIPLSQGKFAIVDEEDYEWLTQWKWFINNRGYAVRWTKAPNRKLLLMHRMINNTPKNMETDHIDGNPLNNHRINLRSCTHKKNGKNRKKQIGTSIYKGVCHHGQCNKWRAQIRVNYKKKYLGLYSTEIEAARAYNRAAKKYFKEFAKLNDI